jgi:hypothetical protein
LNSKFSLSLSLSLPFPLSLSLSLFSLNSLSPSLWLVTKKNGGHRQEKRHCFVPKGSESSGGGVGAHNGARGGDSSKTKHIETKTRGERVRSEREREERLTNRLSLSLYDSTLSPSLSLIVVYQKMLIGARKKREKRGGGEVVRREKREKNGMTLGNGFECRCQSIA